MRDLFPQKHYHPMLPAADQGPWRWAYGGHGSGWKPLLMSRHVARVLLPRGACRRCVLFLRTFGQPYPWKCTLCACGPDEATIFAVASYMAQSGKQARGLFTEQQVTQWTHYLSYERKD